MIDLAAILHVGFAHSGTKSLQQNFLACRADLFYCGIPYGEFGSIFSNIKYQDRALFNESVNNHYVKTLILDRDRVRSDQTVVVSDETMIEQPEVYYTPAMMPLDIICARLRALFTNAKVLFTIRNQISYVRSSYFNLKRNYALIDRRPVEDFSDWFAGNQTQVANLFLRNLDYSLTIRQYIEAFGRPNVVVVALESLQRKGARAYLESLGRQLGLTITAEDVMRFAPVRNARMTELESAIISHWSDEDFRRLHDRMVAAVGPTQWEAAKIASGPAELTITNQQVEIIRTKAAPGNAFIAQEFGLPLASYGYPI